MLLRVPFSFKVIGLDEPLNNVPDQASGVPEPELVPVVKKYFVMNAHKGNILPNKLPIQIILCHFHMSLVWYTT